MAGKPTILIAAGTRFGRYTVIRQVEATHDQRRWLCRCDCGNERPVDQQCLTRGEAKSCGCLKVEIARGRCYLTRTHGESQSTGNSTEYRIWGGIIQRCCNPAHPAFRLYGGRGISIDSSWRHSFESFLSYVGRRPSSAYTIDRWPDKNGNYEPGNVRWATWVQQQRNRRNNVLVDFRGERITLAEFAEKSGIKAGTIRARLAKGYSIEEAFSTPLGGTRNGCTKTAPC
jgi:hypothetical protein